MRYAAWHAVVSERGPVIRVNTPPPRIHRLPIPWKPAQTCADAEFRRYSDIGDVINRRRLGQCQHEKRLELGVRKHVDMRSDNTIHTRIRSPGRISSDFAAKSSKQATCSTSTSTTACGPQYELARVGDLRRWLEILPHCTVWRPTPRRRWVSLRSASATITTYYFCGGSLHRMLSWYKSPDPPSGRPPDKRPRQYQQIKHQTTTIPVSCQHMTSEMRSHHGRVPVVHRCIISVVHVQYGGGS